MQYLSLSVMKYYITVKKNGQVPHNIYMNTSQNITLSAKCKLQKDKHGVLFI